MYRLGVDQGDDDDNPVPEWFQRMPTVIDARPEPLAETTPHRSLDHMAGRESGYGEGVERVCAALERELVRAGLSFKERLPIIRRVRDAALRAG